VDEDGIFPLTGIQLTDWKNSERILFSGENEIVFETVEFKTPVSDLVMGNILEKINQTDKVVQVKLPDGRTGFVSSEYIVNFKVFKDTVKVNPIKIKEIAEQFTGRPYLWGGTSARAMDCSGFVKTIYFMNGLILARDASLQIRHGELIKTSANFDNLEIGDLLFFGKTEENGTSEKMTHVALSLSGTEYIHASGRIKKNSLNPESEIFSEYRKNSFVRARRIVGSEDRRGIQQLKEHPWY
jgi:cell wall-associated NlpC family hydrolase